MTLLCAALAVFVPMAFEAQRSRRHDRALRAMGAVEPPGDVYGVMQVVYPGLFVAMLAEGAWRGAPADRLSAAGAVVFVAAKLLKYSAVRALGVRWTFRVLVPPGSSRTVGGPYRVLRHPNYVAVMGEIAGVSLLVHAFVTGPVAWAGFGGLIAARVRVEERALGLRRPSQTRGTRAASEKQAETGEL